MKTRAIMPVLLSQMAGLPALLMILLIGGLAIGLLYPTASFAAGCPQFTHLGALTDRTFEPVRVAVSDGGDAYVTDWFNGNLRVFDYKGGLLKTKSIDPASHTGLDNTGPLGVAVDATGRIYVGRADVRSGVYTGEVTVYNSNLTPLYKLGQGYGEFQYPGAIATDAERVYVADDHTNLVKVYDKITGDFIFSFGGYAAPYDIGGSVMRYDYLPGSLVSPNGIAVDPATGYIYVTDRALYCSLDVSMQSGGDCGATSSYTGGSGSASWGRGAGIHVFKLSGDKTSVTLRRRLGEFSFNLSEGKLYQPGGIAVSGDKAIVSDSVLGVLHVFDTASGTAVSSCLKSVSQPAGLAAGADGRLLVATKGAVAVYGLDNYVRMAVAPDPLLVDSKQCTSEPVTAALTIYNDGPGVLNWEISEDIPWLTPSLSSGSIDGQTAVKSVNVPVTINLSGIELSSFFEDNIIVRAQGEVESVGVKVRVSLPEITVTPDVLYFAIDGTDAPDPKSLSVKLSSDTSGSLRWSAFSDSAWMTVSPSDGPSGALAIANVSIDMAKIGELDGTEHTGYISVAAGCATGSPAIIPVKVTGQVAKGTLQVTTNIAAAPVTITGSGAVTAGTSQSIPHTYSVSLAAGTYTVTFGAVAGFKAPAPQIVSITGGNLTEAAGDYLDLRDKLDVITTMGSGQWYVADEIKVYDGSGSLSDTLTLASSTRTRSGMREGRATASGDVDGDGKDDIVAATDKGAVIGLKADGTPIAGLNFTAFSYGTGVNLAVADIDGDGAGEIMVGAGEKAGNPAALRVFSYSGGRVVDTGINFIAHEEMYGVKVAAGDVDGDGAIEMATTPGGGGSASVRLWRVDTAGGTGAWKAVDAGGFSAGPSALSPAVSVADVDADSVDEIIVARGAAPASGSATITAFRADGTKALEFTIDAKGPLSMAAGDTDMDGIADVVVGENSAQSSSIVRIYKNGVLGKEFPAFSNGDIYGVRVSLGRAGGAR